MTKSGRIRAELRVLMPWRSAWRYRGHLLRITASCPHAVTMRDDIEDICVEETDYGNIYIFWGTLFFVPLPKIHHVNRLDYKFMYTLMVTLIFFNRRMCLKNNHKIFRSKYLLLSDWLNLPGYFLTSSFDNCEVLASIRSM